MVACASVLSPDSGLARCARHNREMELAGRYYNRLPALRELAALVA
jgi:hypothetical protein